MGKTASGVPEGVPEGGPGLTLTSTMATIVTAAVIKATIIIAFRLEALFLTGAFSPDFTAHLFKLCCPGYVPSAVIKPV